MKTKTAYGKTLFPNMLPEDQITFLPEDYDLPCYRVVVNSDGFRPAERGFYYADILVDDAMRIRRIERYKDNYMVNIFVSTFPPALETVFEEIMQRALT